MNRSQTSTIGRLILTTLLGSGLLLGAASQVLAGNSHTGQDQRRWEERQQRHGDNRDHRSHVQARQTHQQVIRELPRQALRIRVGRQLFYRHGDQFYSRQSSGFLRVAPPTGVIVAKLPGSFIRIDLGGYSYFRSGEVYYRPVRGGYLVVDPIARGQLHSPIAVTVRVAANRLNVRTGPGRNYAIIGRVSFGDVLAVNDAAPGWHRVILPDGRCGWIMSRYTRRLVAG